MEADFRSPRKQFVEGLLEVAAAPGQRQIVEEGNIEEEVAALNFETEEKRVEDEGEEEGG